MQSEQKLVDGLIQNLVSALGPLAPYAKAVVTAAGGLATSLANWAISGSFNALSITSAAGGVVLALVVYEVPNLTKKAPAPVKAATTTASKTASK